MKEQQAQPSLAQQVFGFCKRAVLFAVADVALSLAIWLVLSLAQGRFASPAGALLLGAVALFILAMLPFFFDVGGTLLLPLRVLVQKKDAQQILKEDRPRSETGMTLTFALFAAGLIVLLLSFVAGRVFG